jgi:ParB family chromosome partitioning protein
MTMTTTRNIPLNKLSPWEGNVRKTEGSDTALAELAASIASIGLIQPLSVQKGKGDQFDVVAGKRRLAALKRLVKAGTIKADHPVPCMEIAKNANATEISLAENAVREDMHPADEFDAFRELADKCNWGKGGG